MKNYFTKFLDSSIFCFLPNVMILLIFVAKTPKNDARIARKLQATTEPGAGVLASFSRVHESSAITNSISLNKGREGATVHVPNYV